ncbi:class I SAM-dependent methyltransferase [Dyadobacter flavalbus]|uniref:Class I SAM-dependent methyltransferase n=1 Tax=Dyadobacter flavalbus TaxID=2579942 RepID=A0A5M8Q3G1_9BACT|nr:class I SAM-dependent methyltransferase [Dyadobacter flavalbus]KAA6430379.1 class I SAM-dependent methyltransferase [Dyadobacter flavalbus]
MIKKIKNNAWNVLNGMGLGGSVQLILDGALKQYGWFRSFHTKQSVDANGDPLPWYTYPFILFLKPRIKPHFNVFEYGSGNSTRWYAARVKHITAVEHDADWIKQISPKLPANAKVLEKPLGESYIKAVKSTGDFYNIIVVDGRNRVKCAVFAASYLTPDGVLILDNSEREWYSKAKEFLAEKGFRRLDFIGMAPIVGIETCTSVFYRDNNCLGI